MNESYNVNGFYLEDKTSICPNCGQNTFTRYINDNGQYLPKNVGLCSRMINCCYQYSAWQYFKDQNIETKSEEIEKNNNSELPRYYKIVNKHLEDLQEYLCENNFKRFEKNNFISYLIEILGFQPSTVLKQLKLYNVKPAECWYLNNDIREEINEKGQLLYRIDDVLFFYVSILQDVKTISQISYFPNFHRLKDEGTYLLHKQYQEIQDPPANKIQWCMFGEHLISSNDYPENKGKKIIVVESEKTAFTMSLSYPQYIWTATGGLNRLSDDYGFCPPNRIIFMPDANIDVKGKSCADKWRKRLKDNILIYNENFMVVDFHNYCDLEEIKNGFDILDLQLKDKNRVDKIFEEIEVIV